MAESINNAQICEINKFSAMTLSHLETVATYNDWKGEGTDSFTAHLKHADQKAYST